LDFSSSRSSVRVPAGVMSLGVLNMSRMVGMALGVAVSVALLSSYAPAHMTDAQNEITAVIVNDQQIPPAMKGQIGEQLAAMSNVKGPQQDAGTGGHCD
jgi:hypothetical protein